MASIRLVSVSASGGGGGVTDSATNEAAARAVTTANDILVFTVLLLAFHCQPWELFTAVMDFGGPYGDVVLLVV